MTAEGERQLLAGLGSASSEIAEMSRNPMFLGLLCDYVRTKGAFPTSVHAAFETYVENRLTRDTHRLQQRFDLSPKQVRAFAQSVAFCMASVPGLGLSPLRDKLRAAMVSELFPVGQTFETALDALEFIKLARSEATLRGAPLHFTFSHRRFQEYFATSVVLNEPSRISPTDLLSDGRWRETAVVMCQLQPTSALVPLLQEVEHRLASMLPANGRDSDSDSPEADGQCYLWPPGCLHLLGILQEGFSRRRAELPRQIRQTVGRLVDLPSRLGDLGARKYAVEVSGTASDATLIEILRGAFQSDSNWLRDAAYRQIGHLKEVPADIAEAIRMSLIRMGYKHRLETERFATEAYLARLTNGQDFLRVATLIRSAFRGDLLIHIAFLLILLTSGRPVPTLAGSMFALWSYAQFRYDILAAFFPKMTFFRSLFLLVVARLYMVLILSLSYISLYEKYQKHAANAPHVAGHFRQAFTIFFNPVSFVPLRRWIETGLLSYALLWAPAIIWVVRRRAPSIITAVFAPFAVVCTKTIVKRVISKAAVTLAGTLLLFGTVVAACLLYIPDRLAMVIAWVLISLVSLGLGFAIYELTVQIYRDLRAWRTWQRALPESGGKLSADTFVEQLLGFETEFYRTRFVRAVRDRSLVPAGEATRAAIAKAAARESTPLSAALLDDMYIMLEQLDQRI